MNKIKPAQALGDEYLLKEEEINEFKKAMAQKR